MRPTYQPKILLDCRSCYHIACKFNFYNKVPIAYNHYDWKCHRCGEHNYYNASDNFVLLYFFTLAEDGKCFKPHERRTQRTLYEIWRHRNVKSTAVGRRMEEEKVKERFSFSLFGSRIKYSRWRAR